MNSDPINIWPFDQPRNCATITTRPVMERLEPIILVAHEADDHSWQFIGASKCSMADALLVSLQSIVKLDPTVLEIADLEPGWQATRENVGGTWTRSVNPPNPDDQK